MKKIFLALVLLFGFLYSDITKSFPTLDGRVVDTYGLLYANEKKELSDILKKHEEETSNQIVIVILNSLEGYEIADYSYQLGRHWGIGQKDKDNGVLLVISMKDRKLRIEVGYGLEGALTDKISHEIIEYTLKPAFKTELYKNGLFNAVGEIIQAIKGEYINKVSSSSSLKQEPFFPIIFFVIIFISMMLTNYSSKSKNLFLFKTAKSSLLSSFFGFFTFVISQGFTQYNLIIALIVFIIVFIFNFLSIKKISAPKLNNYSSNSYSSTGGYRSSNSGSFGGGFSGGGGSFGGGGASGGW